MTESLLSHLSPLYTDLYQLKMAQGYFLTGKHHQKAVFDLHYRTNPYKSGYVIVAGINEVVECLSNFSFSKEDIEYLKVQGFRRSFLNYLSSFSFEMDIDSVPEGEVVFPHEPILRAEGGLLECQLAETILINMIHFPSLIATKASRLVKAAEGRVVIDFGLRRAQGLAGVAASRAAYIGGVNGTSNVFSGKMYGVPVFGTQAHSWIQSFQDEEKAFIEFGRIYPKNNTMLIDTYSTLKSGLPSLIKAAKQLRSEGIEISGVRLDSGDLAYLSKRVRKELDKEGFSNIKIFVSGSLDEYLMESLIKQKAVIDGFGVGTKLITSFDEPALDMVYKLSIIDGSPEFKISDSVEKMNEPGRKKILRYFNGSEEFQLDAIVLKDDKKTDEVMHPYYRFSKTDVKNLHSEELLAPHMKKGRVVRKELPLEKIRAYSISRLAKLPDEHKRFYNPHTYRVGVSSKLFKLKEKLIKKTQKK